MLEAESTLLRTLTIYRTGKAQFYESTATRDCSRLTCYRNVRPAGSLIRTLKSIADQCWQPSEIIVVDGSKRTPQLALLDQHLVGLASKVKCVTASARGAATQRNEGVQLCLSMSSALLTMMLSSSASVFIAFFRR